MDGADRAGSRRRDSDHRRRARRARVVESQGRARRREPPFRRRPTPRAPFAAPAAGEWHDDLADALLRRAHLRLRPGHGAHRRGLGRGTGWNVNLAEMARIWKGGCIIRARLLDPVRAAFARNPTLVNLLVDPAIGGEVQRADAGLAPRRSAAASGGRHRRFPRSREPGLLRQLSHRPSAAESDPGAARRVRRAHLRAQSKGPGSSMPTGD